MQLWVRRYPVRQGLLAFSEASVREILPYGAISLPKRYKGLLPLVLADAVSRVGSFATTREAATTWILTVTPNFREWNFGCCEPARTAGFGR